ncbi:MAG: BMP family ABC transporter substrate-binding protein [Clostridia bacterium]
MKKLFSLLLVVAMLATSVSVFVACGEQGTGKICLITDVGTIDDKSFNQGAWEGVKAYAKANKLAESDIKYIKPYAASDADYLDAIDLAVAWGARTIVTPGFLFEVPIFEAQTRYPDVKFILLDGAPHTLDYSTFRTDKNVASVTYAEEEVGYLAGYAAVKDGFTDLGFLGGMSVPAVVAFGYGYLKGADDAAKELNITVDIQHSYLGNFGSEAVKNAAAATTMFQNADVIFACAGGAGMQVMDVAGKLTDKWVIGVDVDQYNTGAGKTCITSATKGLAKSVQDILTSIRDGKFDIYGGKTTVFNAKVDGIGLPIADLNADTAKVGQFKTFTVGDYKAIYAKLVAGTVKDLARTVKSAADLPTAEEIKTGLKLTNVILTVVK